MEQDGYYFNKLPEIAQKMALLRMDGHSDWLKNLDRTVNELAEKWKLTLGEVLEGGAASLIVEGIRENGDAIILKLALPGNSIYSEALVLRSTNGNGYVTLYEVDFEREALLLEKLGSPLSGTRKTIDEHIVILCEVLKKSWIKPEVLNLPTSAHKALEMRKVIRAKWADLNEPFSRQTLALAMIYAEERMNSFDPESSVLCHGDAHGFNVLEAENGTYKFVDPDGIIGDKAYDLICIMRDWSDVLLAGNALDLLLQRCTWLSELTGVNKVAIWQWGYLGRLLIGLTLLELGHEQGRSTLEVADKISHHRWV